MAFRSDYDLITFFKFLHYYNLDCCIKTCEYFILAIKETVKRTTMENLEENALIELCSFSIDILAFVLVKLCGFLFIFRHEGRSFATKSCPLCRNLDGKKLVALLLAKGGGGGVRRGVTSQIDPELLTLPFWQRDSLLWRKPPSLPITLHPYKIVTVGLK